MDEKKITLRRGSDCWTATFEGPEAQEIAALMGTTTIPTPYKPSCDAGKVHAALAIKNPGYLVVVR